MLKFLVCPLKMQIILFLLPSAWKDFFHWQKRYLDKTAEHLHMFARLIENVYEVVRILLLRKWLRFNCQLHPNTTYNDFKIRLFPGMCFTWILWYRHFEFLRSLVFSFLTSTINWDPCWRLFFDTEYNDKWSFIYRDLMHILYSQHSWYFYESQLLLLNTCMHLVGKRLIYPWVCVHVCSYVHIHTSSLYQPEIDTSCT